MGLYNNEKKGKIQIKGTTFVKGLLFLAIGILFYLSKSYEINQTISILLPNAEYPSTFDISMTNLWGYYFDEFFKVTIYHFIFAGLFIAVGLLEIKEAFTHGNQ